MIINLQDYKNIHMHDSANVLLDLIPGLVNEITEYQKYATAAALTLTGNIADSHTLVVDTLKERLKWIVEEINMQWNAVNSRCYELENHLNETNYRD